MFQINDHEKQSDGKELLEVAMVSCEVEKQVSGNLKYNSLTVVAFNTLLKLLSVFVCYLLYNRLNKPTRIWLYGFLRLLRVAAFVAVVPVTVIGAVALSAYTISKWIPYLNYRTVGGDWDECNNDTIRLMLFVFISVLIAGAVGSHIFWSFSAWILLGWHLFKARREMKSILGQAHRIDRAAT